MKCYYHKSDFDGICSAAIVKYAYPSCELIPSDYEDKLDLLAAADETVFVVDFSFSVDEMIALNEHTSLVWIDHHISAIEKMARYENSRPIEGIRLSGGDDNIGACALVWKFLYNRKMPEAVRLLAEYDVWNHTDEATLSFQYGMRAQNDTGPNSSLWTGLFTYNSYVTDICDTGRIIIDYEKKQNAMYAKGMAFEATDFHGLRAIVINKAYANSMLFESVYDPEKHDIMILFGVKPNSCKYSVYTDKDTVDVSKVAKIYGGGGHKNAAGFCTEKCLF